jgi:hypothetical protein
MPSATCVGDAWKMVLDAFGSILQESEQEVLNSLTKFVDQLPLIMSEVCVNCCIFGLCHAFYFNKYLVVCVKGKTLEVVKYLIIYLPCP